MNARPAHRPAMRAGRTPTLGPWPARSASNLDPWPSKADPHSTVDGREAPEPEPGVGLQLREGYAGTASRR